MPLAPLSGRSAIQWLWRLSLPNAHFISQENVPAAKGKAALGSQQQGAAAAPAPAVQLPSPAEALGPLLEPLATMLYDTLRPAVVVMQDMDELCELVDILKHEVGSGCHPGSTRVWKEARRLQPACTCPDVGRARRTGGRAPGVRLEHYPLECFAVQ